MRTDPILAVLTIPASWTRAYKLTMRVEGGLHNITGNHKPYFSLTCTIHRKGHPNQCQSGGCDHETILKYCPQFADLAALHLSDIDGKPLHAEANGWYSLAGALPNNAGERYHAGNSQRHFPKPPGAPRRGNWDTTDYREPTPDECLEIFARRARVTIETAHVLRDHLIDVWHSTREECEEQGVDDWTWSAKSWRGARQVFAAWIDAQAPRWKAEYVVIDALTGDTIGLPLVSIDAAQDMLTVERRKRGLLL